MARVPLAEVARILSFLTPLLVSDAELRRLVAANPPDALLDQELYSVICGRLHLPDEPWALLYVAELVEYQRKFEAWTRDRRIRRGPPPRVPLVMHYRRQAHEFSVGPEGQVERYLVDAEAPVRATGEQAETVVADQHLDASGESDATSVDNATSTTATPTARSLEELEEISGAPTSAREWWDENELAKHRKPARLRRAVAAYYRYCWCLKTLQQISDEFDLRPERIGQYVETVRQRLKPTD